MAISCNKESHEVGSNVHPARAPNRAGMRNTSQIPTGTAIVKTLNRGGILCGALTLGTRLGPSEWAGAGKVKHVADSRCLRGSLVGCARDTG